MNDRRRDLLDPADEAFIDHALLAGREDLPDETRLRAIEGRLGSALEAESSLSGWWTRSRLFPVVGLAAVALALAGVSSVSLPSRTVATAAPTVSAPSEPTPTTTTAVESTSTSPTASIAVDALPAAKTDEPGSVVKATSTHEAKARPQPSAVATATSARSDELAVLEEASRALDTSPQKALALTDEHLNRFRRPRFAQERERLAIVALLRLGRRDDAKRRADAFEAAFPESAHLARIRELVRP